MQIVYNTDNESFCSKCGQNLMILGKFLYTGVTTNTPYQKDEKCVCKRCGQYFIIRYKYFDENNHINSFVFNGDVNDSTYNWQDQLTPEQKQKIGIHLKSCEICNNRLTEEALTDAWLASLIHNEAKS